MYMHGITGEKAHESAKKILLQMGEYFQIQDDYIDCYGDPVVTGKIGTDIEENKCSWLVIQALQLATPQQRSILEENYARRDPACVQKVKALYKELNLEQVYKDYEEQSYKDLMVSIETEAGSLPQGMFVEFANRIYKRKN
ncbi:Farnesyl pyrophosphate synthase [Geodia barretti]|uniref:Farnesyl pyrophosphate synthase n=1 Tax=Geodia barretti TaxID=519541 RepID=A0AA35R4B3_GEOBA|nr:Farnesyl pyrophosphate synthase [Geodia barretti]